MIKTEYGEILVVACEGDIIPTVIHEPYFTDILKARPLADGMLFAETFCDSPPASREYHRHHDEILRDGVKIVHYRRRAS